MPQILSIGVAPVVIRAVGATRAVTVRPLSFPIEFLIYTADGSLETSVMNDSYAFVATGQAFEPGEVVGYVAVRSGTRSFEFWDGT